MSRHDAPVHRSQLLLIIAVIPFIAAATLFAAEAPPGKGLLIVAPERFHAALGEFVRHKRTLLPAELVSLESVLKSSPGVDDPERLKRFLFAAWHEKKIGYALLVGDSGVLPVRYMVLDRITPAAFDYAFYPSDLYYADLAKQDDPRAFDDWNAHKEGFHAGYFGEVRGEKNKGEPINYDAVDYRPDIAVGRWPVRTAAEVETVAAKTIAYEKAILAGSAPGMRRAVLLCVSGWVESRPRMDALAKMLPRDWSVEKRYFADAKRNDNTPLPNEEQLVALLNDGVGLVCHAGHGNDNAWEKCFSAATLPRLRNADRLPVMISIGCSTARFATLPPYEPYMDVNGLPHEGTDSKKEVFKEPPPPPAVYQSGRYDRTGLGKQLLRRGPSGAVAYIGCNTGSQPCALTLLDGFVNALGKAKTPRLGDCWAEAVVYYYDQEHLAALKPDADWYPPSIFFQGMKFMLFGDPSLRMPAAEIKP